jgi:ferredoxin
VSRVRQELLSIKNINEGKVMAVKITDICIACGACIDECPVGAIVDDSENPTGAES